MERKKNVYCQLRNREYGITTKDRSKFKILQTLAFEENYIYEKVWERFSNKHIACEGGKIYFDNYTKCFGGYGLHCKPRFLHSLYTPHGKKIDTALVASVHLDEQSQGSGKSKSALFCLVGRNWLVRYDFKTGKLLQEVFLSPMYHFRDLSWNEPNKSIVLRSTHNINSLSRQAAIMGTRVVKFLALFEIFPVRFTGMFEITKTVFGKDVVDAMVSQGILFTMHYSGFVKFYSLEYILQKFMKYPVQLYQEVEELGHTCGHLPVGLPFNIVIKEQPPILFQVKCHQHSVEIGGFPWHYLFTPHGKQGTFLIKSVANGHMARNGNLEMKTLNFEPDRAVFYNDESGRILHVGPTEVSMYEIQGGECGRAHVEKSFSIDMDRHQYPPFPLDSYTSSGRRVRRTHNAQEMTEYPSFLIHNVDYEDDLNILCTSAVYFTHNGLEGVLRFHNNYTGQTLKTIDLHQPFEENYEHHVHVDLDTVTQIVKSCSGLFTCIMYRLKAKLDEEDQRYVDEQEKHWCDRNRYHEDNEEMRRPFEFFGRLNAFEMRQNTAQESQDSQQTHGRGRGQQRTTRNLQNDDQDWELSNDDGQSARRSSGNSDQDSNSNTQPGSRRRQSSRNDHIDPEESQASSSSEPSTSRGRGQQGRKGRGKSGFAQTESDSDEDWEPTSTSKCRKRRSQGGRRGQRS